MSKPYFPKYPPYLGSEPYLYLCFPDADAQRVKPLLAEFLKRGCRVYYSIGRSANKKQIEERAGRIQNASLFVLCLTPSAASDASVKSMLGFYQAHGGPVISIDSAQLSDDSGYDFLNSERVRHVDADADKNTEELVKELMRTEGFSQALLGELPRNSARRAALILFTATLLLLIGTFLYGRSHGWFTADAPAPVPVDTVQIADDVIRQAARDALSPDGSVAITSESIEDITSLRLSDVPASYDALSLFPGLTKLIIPQSAVESATALTDDYTVVVYGEAMQ